MARQIKTTLGIKVFQINDNLNLNGKNCTIIIFEEKVSYEKIKLNEEV